MRFVAHLRPDLFEDEVFPTTLRHQVRAADTYHFIDKKKTAIGGFTVSLVCDEVRIDHVQHNILSLLATWEILK